MPRFAGLFQHVERGLRGTSFGRAASRRTRGVHIPMRHMLSPNATPSHQRSWRSRLDTVEKVETASRKAWGAPLGLPIGRWLGECRHRGLSVQESRGEAGFDGA